MAKFCHNCGSPVREGAAFCGNCGTKLSIAPEAVPAPEAIPVAAVEAPAAEPAPAVEAAPVAEQIPVAEPAPAVEQIPVAEPVISAAAEPAAETVPVTDTAPVAEAVPVVEPVAETVPVTDTVPVAVPVAATVAVPAAAPAPAAEAFPEVAPAPVAPAPFEAAPVSAAPMPFEAPSGPVPVTVPNPASADAQAPKKNKGALIAILIASGVVLLALLGVGIWAVLNGGFGIGGTIIDRIEKKDKVESGKKYAIYDEDFNDYIVEARWWDYDSTMDKPGMYNTDTETLAFSIEVNEDAEDEIYYAYYYSKDKEFDKDDLSKPVYSTTIPPEEYGDGRAFYNVDCSKKIQKGYYVVVVASDESLKKPYVIAYADVK